MQQNVGGADRMARFIGGTALLGGGLATTDARLRTVLLAGAAIALGTAIVRYCPANTLLGIDTAD